MNINLLNPPPPPISPFYACLAPPSSSSCSPPPFSPLPPPPHPPIRPDTIFSPDAPQSYAYCANPKHYIQHIQQPCASYKKAQVPHSGCADVLWFNKRIPKDSVALTASASQPQIICCTVVYHSKIVVRFVTVC
jgi:hypothetical protein